MPSIDFNCAPKRQNWELNKSFMELAENLFYQFSIAGDVAKDLRSEMCRISFDIRPSQYNFIDSLLQRE